MTIRALVLVATLSVATVPATAQEAETNRQSPAPQGTVAPSSNEKAATGSDTGTRRSEEQTKSQSPGKSEETELSKKAKEGASAGNSSNREVTNPQAPAPNNTSRSD